MLRVVFIITLYAQWNCVLPQLGSRNRCRSRKDSEVLSEVGFLRTLEVGAGVGYFVRRPLWKSN